ncbi:MAG: cysteine--tRNA ligase [Chloroflexota bacterium]
MALMVYNSLTRCKEEFVPLEPGRVLMYVCGPTVYDYTHIGHAKLYVSMDVVLRYLRYLGYKVRYVQNITDVGHLTDDADAGEDKIEKRAVQERVEPMELAETYTREYFWAMDALNVTRPDISPRASGHVIEQIEMVKALLAKGHAYEANGSVYFDVTSYPAYGKLSGRKVEEQEAGARVEVLPEKRHPADFALWKRAEPGHILRWPSPWGEGYPGWHVECSAMAQKYLGQTFDIHGGGLENIFPHNECEVAQSEAAHGVPFACYWLHAGTLTVDGVKMGKSLGNALFIRNLLDKYAPEDIRFFILTSHYRGTIDFSDPALRAAGEGLGRIHGTVEAVRQRLAQAPEGEVDGAFASKLAEHKARFLSAMDDDFNAPGAIGVLFDLSRQVNSLLGTGQPNRDTLEETDKLYSVLAGDILGILPFSVSAPPAQVEAKPFIDLLLQVRQELRAARQWDLADRIRQGLSALNLAVEDTPQGPRWRVKE